VPHDDTASRLNRVVPLNDGCLVVALVSLFVWGFLLGGIGAILAVPLTMLTLAALESFDSTRWVAMLLRLAPEEKDEEHAAAMDRLKGLWGGVTRIGG
jgi:hypothetical protein